MELATRKSLLMRLGSTPGSADWEVFYERYAGVILSFAQQRGLDPHGARDVLQETMMVLMRKLPEFRYDPERGRFRNWLLTIVANKIREAHRRTRAAQHFSLDVDEDDANSWHERLPAGDASAAEALEDSWRQALLAEALRQILEDPHTKPESIAVFRACALEGQAVSEVSARLGMKENAVYQIKNRLMKRLREVVAELEGEAK